MKLVDRINVLSAHGMPPTPQFVKNMIFELSQSYVGDHWVSRFVKRHKDELCNLYLDSIDYTRRVIDNCRHFKDYFDKVSAYLNLN